MLYIRKGFQNGGIQLVVKSITLNAGSKQRGLEKAV